MLPPSYDQDKTRRYPVLYYLHGLGDNEQSLVNGGGWNLYEDLLAQNKVGEYIIVTPNGFRSFYINSKDGKFLYEDFFIKEFLPAIERKYRVRVGRGGRGIMGVSMGGYGAFHYAFKYPQKFISVSGHMSALRETPPPSLDGTPDARLLGVVFGTPFDPSYYKNNSPFTLVRNAPLAALKGMSIYFDAGSNDDYNFDAGAEALHKLLVQRGVKHEFHIYPGGHSWAFMAEHFGASLELHSRAFGLTK